MTTGDTLTFRSGHRVTVLAEGTDDQGTYLRLRHELPIPARQAGPHWHPVLTERWTVRQGAVRFRIAGRTIHARPGDTVTAPARTVHEFRSAEPNTVIEHEIRPALRHRRMFELWCALDNAGRTTCSGVPRDPLALALLWEQQDGYLAGIPARPQRAILGPLAALARKLGYERRWSADRTANR
ncbi:cupin domain-containing protein [Nocardia paucivorans]|uniref:cupin domain-containing protein n=1 Tax=Nocardia paucivorans TaxID=114259 RepID=UPI0003159ECA|nr:cupin domain-containing protein [Nocardia paucivorans]